MVVRVAAPEEALEKLRAVVARGGLSVVIGGAAVVATLLVVAGNMHPGRLCGCVMCCVLAGDHGWMHSVVLNHFTICHDLILVSVHDLLKKQIIPWIKTTPES